MDVDDDAFLIVAVIAHTILGTGVRAALFVRLLIILRHVDMAWARAQADASIYMAGALAVHAPRHTL